MTYIEVLLFSILLVTCCYASYTDIKRGIVYNRCLLIALVIGTLIDALYYGFYANHLITVFTVNLSIITLISLVFYSYNIWAGGDSKLFITIAVLMPASVYGNNFFGIMPSLSILICTFTAAFIYVIIESIISGIKKGNLLEPINLNKEKIRNFLKQFLYCVVYISFFCQICIWVLPSIYSSNSAIMLLLNMVFVLTILNFDLFKPQILAGILVIIIISVVFYEVPKFRLPDFKFFILLLFLIILRKIAQQYNYVEIHTDEVKPGMILSIGTVAIFGKSRIKGLPQAMAENMKSRLTKDEVESIRRWGQSKGGMPTIIIVKKIPFAIFITLGTVIFILMRCIF